MAFYVHFSSKKLHNYIEEKDSTSDEQGMFNKWFKKFVDSVTNSTNPNSYLEASKKKFVDSIGVIPFCSIVSSLLPSYLSPKVARKVHWQ